MKPNCVLIILICLSTASTSYTQQVESGHLRGTIEIDSSWSSNIYLSYLPTFEDIYTMSPEMIIGETKIDSDGNFSFDLSFLPEAQKLYRLHITKKGDSRSSLVIGGKNENYLLVIANKNSVINLKAGSVYPPFRRVSYEKDHINSSLQRITDLIYNRDSIASLSDVYKRRFIDNNLKQELLAIADTTSHALISMYAVYQSGFETDYKNNATFYESLAEKWSSENSVYFKKFQSRLPQVKSHDNTFSYLIIALISLGVGLILGKYIPLKEQKVKSLSVQERKILRELRKGARNKDISEKFNIGISTVKSHVSSILSKMNVKSRKELMRYK